MPQTDKKHTEAVILVHGIWMTGLEMSLLGRRLAARGLRPYRFPYSSLRSSPKENARSLARFILARTETRVHLLGHSLGCLLIALMLEQHGDDPAIKARLGRVLALGPPFGGSQLAHTLSKTWLHKAILGQAAPLLLQRRTQWPHPQPLGVIAGDLALGMGLLLPGMPRPHDGLVALKETQIEGATASITLHRAHLAMLFSHQLARLSGNFLLYGQFDHQDGICGL